MVQENYSALIGEKVWNYCQGCKIWISDYLAKIEMEDNQFCDRIDVEFEKENKWGEINGVWVVWYNPYLGEENCNLSVLPIDEQEKIYKHFIKELKTMITREIDE